MRLNKIIVGASAFAMAAALSAGVGSADADAAKVAKSVDDKISIDYAEQTLKVTGATDTKISVAFPTVKDKKVGADKNVCTYDVKGGNVTVDLSTLNVTKDNYIKVWGNTNTTPVIVKIPAATQLGKGTVKTDDNTLTVAKKKETTGVNVALDYAIGNGDFKGQEAATPTKIDVSDYIQLGATLRVRVAASEELTIDEFAKLTADTTNYTVGKGTDKIAVYEATGTFAGKEIKVKVAKLANAPKVKVDWTKGTVTLPKNAEYRVNSANALGTSATGWTAADKVVLKKMTKAAIANLAAEDMKSGEVLDFANGGDIDVRTAKTDKKPASKYTSFVYAKKDILYTDGTSATFTPNSDKVDDTKYDTASSKLMDKETGGTSVGLEVSYARTKGAGKTATSGAITIKNTNDSYVYQYVVVSNSDTAPAVDVKGVKSVKAKTGTATIKFKNKDAYKVYVRRAAVTKDKEAWATDWTEVISLTKTDMVPTAKETTK